MPSRPQVRHTPRVITYRIAEAAEILAVSDDTVRRWVDAGRLPSTRDGGRTTVAGRDLAELAEHLASRVSSPSGTARAPGRSARATG